MPKSRGHPQDRAAAMRARLQKKLGVIKDVDTNLARKKSGIELEDFLSKNHETLKAKLELFDKAAMETIIGIATRYMKGRSVEKAFTDLKILISFDPPTYLTVGKEKMPINNACQIYLGAFEISAEEAIKLRDLVTYCRAYVGKKNILANRDYCNKDGTLVDGMDVETMKQELTQDPNAIAFLYSDLLDASWPKGEEQKYVVAGLTDEEAVIFNIDTVENAAKKTVLEGLAAKLGGTFDPATGDITLPAKEADEFIPLLGLDTADEGAAPAPDA